MTLIITAIIAFFISYAYISYVKRCERKNRTEDFKASIKGLNYSYKHTRSLKELRRIINQ